MGSANGLFSFIFASLITQRSLVCPQSGRSWLLWADGNRDNQESEINDFRMTVYHLSSNLLRQMRELDPDFPHPPAAKRKWKKKKKVL